MNKSPMNGLSCGCLMILLVAMAPVAHGEKIWTNVLSGLWQDGTNWTGHTPPDSTAFIQITNDNPKTVTINALTPATELTVQMLTLSAPPGATNMLLVADAGTNNPLTFQTGLELMDGAALRITNSALLLQLTNDHVNIDGSITLDSGSIDFGDITVTTRVGRATSGLLTINSGTVSAGTMTVGGLTNSTGTLQLNGGLLLVSSLMSIGRNPTTTGTAVLTGGRLNVPNDDARVGDEGVGAMTISNATATLTNLQVGRDLQAVGELALQQGGVVQVQSDVSIARFNGSTGTVYVAGGQLLAGNSTVYVGRGGEGQLSLSNGLVSGARVLVAADTTNSVGSAGLLTIIGGTMSISSNFLVGSVSYSTGQVMVAGGSIVASNIQGTALSSINVGGLTLSGGELVTDNLFLTNAGGQMTFNGGTLITKGTTVANGTPFVVGDGTTAAILRLNGGIHSFADGLIISSNATLEGCGTILGSIINHGTISTNCGGTPVGPGIVNGPVGQTVVLGGTLDLAVTASGSQPLSYQWQLGGINLAGATASSYAKTNVQNADAGNYTVIITNSAGSVTSAAAMVTVLIPPSIATAPLSASAVVGGTATFTVVAAGTQPLSYQWKLFGSNLPGATASSYTKSNVRLTDAGPYTVTVTNSAGTITSPPATLQVVTGLSMVFTSRAGSTNTFSVQSINGTTYNLEFKDSLTATNWTLIVPSITGTGSLLLMQDPSATGPARFYRLHSF